MCKHSLALAIMEQKTEVPPGWIITSFPNSRSGGEDPVTPAPSRPRPDGTEAPGAKQMTACAWRLVVLALVHLMRATPMTVPGVWWWCGGLIALL
mmetsp:Transcript_18419/g.28758  ORF Transcript_18419/g.28758 Transcript_18419/m.28758 type:complete len:95 (-) Transcript_18419:289-573(-)